MKELKWTWMVDSVLRYDNYSVICIQEKLHIFFWTVTRKILFTIIIFSKWRNFGAYYKIIISNLCLISLACNVQASSTSFTLPLCHPFLFPVIILCSRNRRRRLMVKIYDMLTIKCFYVTFVLGIKISNLFCGYKNK